MPLLRHLFERAPGGGLLRLLFRAAGAAADLAAVEQHGHGERLVVVRTALGADGIGKRLPGAALHALLQLGLVVLDMVDLPLGQTVEDVREDKTLRRLEPAISSTEWPRYMAAMTASTASARMDGRSLPPLRSSPWPRRI